MFFSLRILRLFGAVAFCFFCCINAHSGTVPGKNPGNMGGIVANGLPNLSFDIVDPADVGELASLGFEFKMTHQTKLCHGRSARTEWSLPFLKTCAYTDTQGGVIWMSTNGQTFRFRKQEHGYASNNGAVANVSPDGGVIEIVTRDGIKWRHRNGFLESISSRMGFYSVATDRETILSISKKILNREISLLQCAYSKQGFLDEMEFSGGRKYHLQWSTNHDLLAIDGPGGRRVSFQYAGSLLACWTKAGGARNELKWRHLDYVRETAFQIPPVLLREDASFSYVYDLDKWGFVTNVRIYDKAGTLAGGG